jgi:hypothetical protein
MPELDLQIVDASLESIREQVITRAPDVLILEAELLKGTLSLSLLNEFSELKLIGLDLEDNRLLMFSKSTAYGPTTEQLLQMIDG